MIHPDLDRRRPGIPGGLGTHGGIVAWPHLSRSAIMKSSERTSLRHQRRAKAGPAAGLGAASPGNRPSLGV